MNCMLLVKINEKWKFLHFNCVQFVTFQKDEKISKIKYWKSFSREPIAHIFQVHHMTSLLFTFLQSVVVQKEFVNPLSQFGRDVIFDKNVLSIIAEFSVGAELWFVFIRSFILSKVSFLEKCMK